MTMMDPLMLLIHFQPDYILASKCIMNECLSTHGVVDHERGLVPET